MSLKQELLLSAVWESSTEGMRVTDFAGKIVNINKAFCELTGYERASLIEKPFTIIYDKKEQADLMTYYLDFLSSGKKNERSLKKSKFRSGKQLTIEASYSLVEILGEKHVLTIFRDITDLIKSENARLKSENKQRDLYKMIRMMLDNSSDLVWAKDLNNRYTFANKAMCEKLLMAKDTDEPIGKDDMYFAERERNKHKDNPNWHTFGEVCRDTDSAVLKSKKPERFDEYGNVKGKFLFLDVHKAPIFDEKGDIIGTVGSGRDVTEEKKIYEELIKSKERIKLSEEKFRTFADYTYDWEYWISTTGDIIYMSPSCEKISGYKYSEFIADKDLCKKIIHPEDIEVYEKHMRERNGGIASIPELDETEYRIITKTGEVRLIHHFCRHIISADGRNLGRRVSNRDITLTKQAEAAEISLRKQLNKILDLVPSYIFAKDYDGNFLMVNQSLADIFNASPEEVVGKNDSDYGATPEQIEGYLKADRDVIDSGKDIFIKEEQVMRRDGKPGWFQTHKIPYQHPGTDKPAILGVAVDITERKQAEEILRESESKFRTLIDLAVDGILLGSNEGVITDANESMCEIIGMTKDSLIGKHVSLLPFSKESIEANPLRFDLLKKGEVVLNERILIRPDGKEVVVEMRSKMMPDGSYQSIYRDISLRKQVEKEIMLKNDELLNLNAEKDKFFSIIAHDLRTPFMGFLGFTNLLKLNIDQLTNEEIQNIATDMNESALSLFGLLTNLLEWSLMQRGLMSFKPVPLLLNDILENNINVFNDAARKKNIKIENKIGNDISFTADEGMIKTVFRNLISNAIKFTNKGGKVILSAYKSEDNVVISVKDTGIGMNEKLKNNLFKIDMKVSREGTEDEPSSGLGLLLCKEFVEKNCGKIFVESEEGKGSEFRITLKRSLHN